MVTETFQNYEKESCHYKQIYNKKPLTDLLGK